MQTGLCTALAAARRFCLVQFEVHGPRVVASPRQIFEEGRRLSRLSGHRAVVSSSDAAEMVRLQLSLAVAGVDATVLAPERLSELGERASREFGFDVLLGNPGVSTAGLAEFAPEGSRRAGDVTEGHLAIFTSGTTGPPRLREYTYSELLAQASHVSCLDGAAWGCFYPTAQFAAVQVLIAALVHDSPLVVLDRRTPANVAACLQAGAVGCVTGTPTLWRQVVPILRREGTGRADVRQITLGGETASQATLDAIGLVFQEARVTHVYASTELGPVLSVSDGRSGFPASWLGHPHHPTRYEIRIENGELQVRPRRSGGEWCGTGDLVAVRGDRVEFQGRSTNVINVGGLKVLPERVEAAIENVPGVLLARVFGQPNPVTGQFVAAEVQTERGTDLENARAAIVTACRAVLAPHEVPRKLAFKEQLEVVNDKRRR